MGIFPNFRGEHKQSLKFHHLGNHHVLKTTWPVEVVQVQISSLWDNFCVEPTPQKTIMNIIRIPLLNNQAPMERKKQGINYFISNGIRIPINQP